MRGGLIPPSVYPLQTGDAWASPLTPEVEVEAVAVGGVHELGLVSGGGRSQGRSAGKMALILS